MNKKLEYKNFDMISLKLNGKGCPAIDWFDLTKKNDLLSVESDSQPHEDLLTQVNKLKFVLAESLGLLDGWDFAREHNRKNEESLRLARFGYDEQIERCNVSGVKITDKGIKVTGSINCDEGVVGLTSPLIKYENEDSNLGEIAKEIIGNITAEVWSFIYQDKRADNLFSSPKEDKSGLGTNTKMEKVA
jgi:hypothetical protein